MASFSEYLTKGQLSGNDFYDNFNLISEVWREGAMRWNEKEEEMKRK